MCVVIIIIIIIITTIITIIIIIIIIPLFHGQVYEVSSIKNNEARAEYLNEWYQGGGVMIMGYAMYRNLSLLTHIRNKKQKAIFLKALVDPGKSPLAG